MLVCWCRSVSFLHDSICTSHTAVADSVAVRVRSSHLRCPTRSASSHRQRRAGITGMRQTTTTHVSHVRLVNRQHRIWLCSHAFQNSDRAVVAAFLRNHSHLGPLTTLVSVLCPTTLLPSHACATSPHRRDRRVAVFDRSTSPSRCCTPTTHSPWRIEDRDNSTVTSIAPSSNPPPLLPHHPPLTPNTQPHYPHHVPLGLSPCPACGGRLHCSYFCLTCWSCTCC